jgi:hypothetical protein
MAAQVVRRSPTTRMEKSPIKRMRRKTEEKEDLV